MITPGYVQMLAAYNAEMNRRLYAAASRLPDERRRERSGAFWGSIHGTLGHLLWGDRQWMSRFDGWPPNTVPLSGSTMDDSQFAALAADRVAADAAIAAWGERVQQSWLDGDLTWFSGAAGRELRKPLGILVAHFFNHQTHHRGQAHALLTAAGEATGPTDLMLIV